MAPAKDLVIFLSGAIVRRLQEGLYIVLKPTTLEWRMGIHYGIGV